MSLSDSRRTIAAIVLDAVRAELAENPNPVWIELARRLASQLERDLGRVVGVPSLQVQISRACARIAVEAGGGDVAASRMRGHGRRGAAPRVAATLAASLPAAARLVEQRSGDDDLVDVAAAALLRTDQDDAFRVLVSERSRELEALLASRSGASVSLPPISISDADADSYSTHLARYGVVAEPASAAERSPRHRLTDPAYEVSTFGTVTDRVRGRYDVPTSFANDRDAAARWARDAAGWWVEALTAGVWADAVIRAVYRPALRVLDFGANAGYLATHLARHAGVNVTGVDLAPGTIALGQSLRTKLALPAVTLRAGAITDADHGAYDVVLALHALTDAFRASATDADAQLTAAASCVAPGGLLLVADTDIAPRALLVERVLHRHGLRVIGSLPLGGLRAPRAAATSARHTPPWTIATGLLAVRDPTVASIGVAAALTNAARDWDDAFTTADAAEREGTPWPARNTAYHGTRGWASGRLLIALYAEWGAGTSAMRKGLHPDDAMP